MNDLDTLFKAALAHHKEGQLPEAEVLYRQILEADPQHRNALSLLGIILMHGSDKAEAESLFLRHLDLEPDDAIALHHVGRLLQERGADTEAVKFLRRASVLRTDFEPIFVDLAESLHRLGYWEEALEKLDHALGIDTDFMAAHELRGLVLYDCERFKEAAEAHMQALANTPSDAIPERISVLLHISQAAYKAEKLELAEQACRAILEIDADNTDGIDDLVQVLYRMRRYNDIPFLLNRIARLKGLERKSEPAYPKASILVLGGVNAGHIPTRYLLDSDIFTLLNLTLVAPDQPDAPLGDVSYEALAEADLVFNSLGEVEKDGGHVEAVKMLLQRLGKPIINLPAGVARTGRDQVKALYGDIPGLIVPEVRWIKRDDPVALSKPFLIRPGGSHGGDDLALIATPDDMTAYLTQVPHDRFLLTDFYDFKGVDGYYRKYRFIFVDRQPFPYHLAISENWLVHYWRARMGCSDWKKREEAHFLSDWRNSVGGQAAAAIEQVAQRMDMDYGGMDCSILPDGKVLLFEANPCMLVHLDESEAEFPYKHQAVPRIRDAMTQMIMDRIRQK